MHLTHSVLQLIAAGTTSTTAKGTATNSSGSYLLLVVIILFGVLYFVRIRPNQRRRMQAMRQAKTFDPADEVVAAGMVGTVVRIGESEVDVEVSPGVVVQFVNQAVQRRAAFVASQQARAGGRGAFGRPAPSSGPPAGTPTAGPVIDVADSGQAGGGQASNGAAGQSATDGMWPPSGER